MQRIWPVKLLILTPKKIFIYLSIYDIIIVHKQLKKKLNEKLWNDTGYQLNLHFINKITIKNNF